MMLLVLGFLFLPICAVIAGFFTWASSHGESLEDGELIRNFSVILTTCGIVLWGTSRTETVRLRIDPQFRMQTELDAHPVYSTIKRVSPDNHKTLHGFLAAQLSQGGTVSDALSQARPLLTQMANDRLGFTGQKTRVAWGQVTVDSLKELEASDPTLCYRALSSQPSDRQTLAQAFSADNTKAFQQAIIQVYESADRGLRHEQPAEDKPVEFNDAAREYYAIMEVISRRFGEPVSKQLSKKSFPEPPIQPPEHMCAARIAQLEAMLERPQAMAAMLIDSVLR